MEKKRRNTILKKVQTEQFIKAFLLASLAIIIALCAFLSSYEMRVKRIDISGLPVLADEASFVIDSASCDYIGAGKSNVFVKGWCAIPGEEIKTISMHVLLRNFDNGECLQMPTAMVARSDVTKYFDDGIKYDNSGFSVDVDTRKVDASKCRYEICILLRHNGEEFLINTGRHIPEE